MGKLFKIVGITLGILLLVVVAALATAVALFDPNDYREQIGAAVEEQTGRSFRIDGELGLSIFPWLAVRAEGMELGNAEGFGEEPFARIGSVSAGIELLPLLLRREIVLDTITLDGLRVNLAVNAAGQGNWEDLLALAEDDDEQQSDGPVAETEDGFTLPSLDVSGINVRDAALRFEDASTGQTHRVEAISLSTGRIRLGEPFTIALGAVYEGGEPPLRAELKLNSVLEADLERQIFALRQLSVEIIASGEAVPAGKQNVALSGEARFTAADGHFELTDGRLQAAGLTADFSAEGHHLDSDTPRFTGRLGVRQFSPRALLSTLAIEAPETRDDKVLRKADMELRFEAGTESAQIPELRIHLDDTTIRGRAEVTSFATQRIDFDVDVDRINIDRYTPPATQVSEHTGEQRDEDTDINALEIPVEALEAINARGRLRVGELIAQGMTMRDVVLQVDLPRGKVKTQKLSAKLYGGSIELDNRITPGDTPRYALRFDVRSVAGGDLLADFLGRDLAEGTADIQVDLSSAGGTVGAIRQALNGTAAITLNDGAVKGFDIARTIRRARARLRGEELAAADGPQKTDFASLIANARITDGVLDITRLDGRNPLFRLLGEGTVNLVGEELNVLARPSIVRSLEGQEGAGLDELAGLEIPIRVRGSWADPQISLDLRKALEQQAAGQLREAADERRDELREKARKEEKRLEERIDRELGDKAGEALRGLFGRQRRDEPEQKQPSREQPEEESAEQQ